jgi:hypothetical protein
MGDIFLKRYLGTKKCSYYSSLASCTAKDKEILCVLVVFAMDIADDRTDNSTRTLSFIKVSGSQIAGGIANPQCAIACP